VQVQRHGAGSMLLLLVVGIMLVVMCDGVMQRRCFRGLVSLVVPENVVYVSYRGPANLPLHAWKKMYASGDHASFHTSAHSVQRTA
jgi:hypothetical protein